VRLPFLSLEAMSAVHARVLELWPEAASRDRDGKAFWAKLKQNEPRWRDFTQFQKGSASNDRRRSTWSRSRLAQRRAVTGFARRIIEDRGDEFKQFKPRASADFYTLASAAASRARRFRVVESFLDESMMVMMFHETNGRCNFDDLSVTAPTTALSSRARSPRLEAGAECIATRSAAAAVSYRNTTDSDDVPQATPSLDLDHLRPRTTTTNTPSGALSVLMRGLPPLDRSGGNPVPPSSRNNSSESSTAAAVELIGLPGDQAVLAMVRREDELRLRHNDRYAIHEQNMPLVTTLLQKQVVREFGMDDSAIQVLRCATTVYPHLYDNIVEASHYRKFNRSRPGSLTPGSIAPDCILYEPAKAKEEAPRGASSDDKEDAVHRIHLVDKILQAGKEGRRLLVAAGSTT